MILQSFDDECPICLSPHGIFARYRVTFVSNSNYSEWAMVCQVCDRILHPARAYSKNNFRNVLSVKDRQGEIWEYLEDGSVFNNFIQDIDYLTTPYT
jgi:uncharacterized OB-fold protein